MAVAAKPTVQRAARPVVAVKRANIAEVVKLDGKLAAQEEVRLTYPGRASVADVMVKAGQAVKQGDVVVEIQVPGRGWAVDVSNSLNVARARMDAAEVGLAAARHQAETRRATAARQASVNQQRHRQAIEDASAALRRAQDNLRTVQAGASAVEKQTARNGVSAAETVLSRAVSDREVLAAGPDESSVRLAQRDVSANQIALAKAQADLEKLLRGADPAAVREADAAVQRATTQLQLAQTTPLDPQTDPAVARRRQEVAIQEAQLSVQQAQARLTALKQPASDIDVRTARQLVQDAEQALEAAQSRVATLIEGPSEATFQVAEDNITRAQVGLDAAQAHLRDVNSRPTVFELADAQEVVRNAQSALDTVTRTPPEAIDSPELEVANAEQALEQARVDVADLEEALEASKMRAPFDGTVVTTLVAPGAVISPTTALLVLARPGPAIVRVDLADDQLGMLTIGQPASVRLERGELAGTPLVGSVTALNPAVRSSAGSRLASADLKVNWPAGETPPLGVPALVDVTVQEKQDVLILPMSAVREVGDRGNRPACRRQPTPQRERPARNSQRRGR